MRDSPPLLEYDPYPRAFLTPKVKFEGEAPERAVLCFFQEVLQELAEDGRLKVVGYLASEIGRNPIYELVWQGVHMLALHPGVGAPLAAAKA